MSYQAAQPSLFQQLPTSMRLPQMAEQLRDWRGEQAALVTLAALGTLLLLRVLASLARTARIARVLRPVPIAPGANLLLGHVIPLLTIPSKGRGAWDLMCDWAAAKGPIVRCRILSTQNVIVSDPLAAKRIFQHRFKVYAKDTVLSYKPFMPILGTGLVTSEGELWQKQRLLMGPALRVDVLDDIISIAKRATDRFSEKFETLRGSGQPVSMEEEFRLLTLQVIGEAILSLPPEECDRVFPALYLPVMEEANHRVLRPYRSYLPTPEWWRFRSNMASLNKYLVNLIRERRVARLKGVAPEKGDILDRIMRAIELSGAPWSEAIETQLCYEIKTFLLAGHETSAAMLMWSMFELSEHPEALAKVRAEAERVYGDAEGEPLRRSVDEMEFTLSVLKETLRKYSVVPVVTRVLKEDDELLGYKIPAGSMITVLVQHIHNQYKDPRAYKPERFMPGGEYDQFDEGVRPYMFLPFIQGPRNCLGQHLALLEARVVLSLLVKRFRFTPMSAEDAQRHPTVIPVASVSGMRMYID